MRGLLEFTKEELISTQLVIGQTFHNMQDLIKNNLEELRELREIYAQKSIDALQLLWNNFDENNLLLIEAQVKDDKYYTDKMYDKVKEEYLSVMPVLRQYGAARYSPLKRPTKFLSQRDLHVHHQRLRFKTMEEEMKGIDMDQIKNIDKMEHWQKHFKQQWIIIKKCHKTIRERFPGMWPDLQYELDYVLYKNMYDTTYSLFNYKIDAYLYPIDHVIPHIGIPTYRMFDSSSLIHPFAVKSAAWAKFEGLCQVFNEENISEGERRQLLITFFITNQPGQPAEEADWEEDDDQRNPNSFEEPELMLFPNIHQID